MLGILGLRFPWIVILLLGLSTLACSHPDITEDQISTIIVDEKVSDWTFSAGEPRQVSIRSQTKTRSQDEILATVSTHDLGDHRECQGDLLITFNWEGRWMLRAVAPADKFPFSCRRTESQAKKDQAEAEQKSREDGSRQAREEAEHKASEEAEQRAKEQSKLERIIYAELDTRAIGVPIECVHAALGKTELACNQSDLDDGVRTFASQVKAALAKVDDLRGLHMDVSFTLSAAVVGESDGVQFLPGSEQRAFAEFYELQNRTGIRLPAPRSANHALACSRALYAMNIIKPQLDTLDRLSCGKLSTAIRCVEHTQRGDNYRGVRVSLRAKFIVPPTDLDMVREKLEGTMTISDKPFAAEASE